MSTVRDKVAVVTGAASGIGRNLTFELARRGARLALSDVNDLELDATADRAKALGAEVHTAHLDVSDRTAFQDYAREVAEHYGVVHQIYNNAGIAGGGTILDGDWESYDRTLAINLFGVINGTKAFLPHLVASGDGHVVNVSSLNGIMGQPTISAYCTSKFGVRGFTESLRGEMLLNDHPVRVTVVHPGGVRTNIAAAGLERARERGEVSAEAEARVRTYNEKLLKMPAEQAARVIINGVEGGKARVLVGNDAKAIDLLVRLFPRLYPALVVRFERRRIAAS